MKSFLTRISRPFQMFLLLAGIACAFPAQAAYKITVIDYPGAIITQVFGINNLGQLVGSASVDGITSIPFLYNPATNLFTVLPNVPGLSTNAVGINLLGVVVGSATDPVTGNASGTILKNGAYTTFSFPGSSFTEARAVHLLGPVTGYASDDSTGNTFGFIYEPARNRYTSFAPSFSTIAQGINLAGTVVGSSVLDANVAAPGLPFGSYGFVRRWNGSLTYFRVNGGQTRARGINNLGKMVGSFNDAATLTTRGFITSVPDQSSFKSLTVAASDLLDVPGAIQTVPEGINDLGRIAGIYVDAAFTSHGFLATPIR